MGKQGANSKQAEGRGGKISKMVRLASSYSYTGSCASALVYSFLQGNKTTFEHPSATLQDTCVNGWDTRMHV